MAETVQEFFDTLPQRDASATAGMNNSYLFDIEGAGQWLVNVTDGAVDLGGVPRRDERQLVEGEPDRVAVLEQPRQLRVELAC